MSGGALALYARWQLRDAFLRALAPVVIFAGIAGIPLWALVRQHTLVVMRQQGPLLEGALQIYGNLMELSMTLGAFVGIYADNERVILAASHSDGESAGDGNPDADDQVGWVFLGRGGI